MCLSTVIATVCFAVLAMTIPQIMFDKTMSGTLKPWHELVEGLFGSVLSRVAPSNLFGGVETSLSGVLKIFPLCFSFSQLVVAASLGKAQP